MTVGGRYYSDTDMLRMQRDAEQRVLEMQDRARQTVEQTNLSPPPPPPNLHSRSWSTNPNVPRSRSQRGRNPEQPAPPPQPEPAPPPAPDPSPQTGPPPEGKSTVLGDIMEALGLDGDYLLIIGLILILINQRADTTLILALAYLLI